MTIANELFRQLDQLIEASFEVDAATLPEGIRGKRPTRSLASLANGIRRKDKSFGRDPRSVKGSPERLAVIAKYRAMAQDCQPLCYQPDDDKQYQAEVRFVEIMIVAGIIDADDLLE